MAGRRTLRDASLQKDGTSLSSCGRFLGGIGILAMLMAGVLFAFWQVKEPIGEPDLPLEEPGTAEEQAQGLHQQPESSSVETLTPKVVDAQAAASTLEKAAVSMRDPLAVEQLIGDLMTFMDHMDPSLTGDQAQLMNDAFQNIVAQGEAAVPAILEFLLSVDAIRFEEFFAGYELDFGALRLGFIDALDQMGGQQAVNALSEVLQHTADPTEVALLAKSLERLAPEQYRQDILIAAKESAAWASQGAGAPGNSQDLGLLFEVMQAFGDSSTVSDLLEMDSQWSHYSTLALAGLPDGLGIPGLINLADNEFPGSGHHHHLASHILAQASREYPEAGKALVRLARAHKISDDVMLGIASVLGGREYRFKEELFNEDLTDKKNKIQHKLIRSGTPDLEIYYSRTLEVDTSKWSAGQFSGRITLIEELIQTTTDPKIISALEDAKDTLWNSRMQFSATVPTKNDDLPGPN